MHGPFDRFPKGELNIYQNWSMKLVALPLLRKRAAQPSNQARVITAR